MSSLRFLAVVARGAVVLLAALSVHAQQTPQMVPEKRVALVIGNAAYPTAPLRNPVNDAKDVAHTLRRLGFDVIEKTNATQKEMNRAIGQFGAKLSGGSIALFFYAGHGVQVNGKNYLIPIDALIDSENSVRVETVDVDSILDQLGGSPLNIVVLDACRNNPFERRFRSRSGGLAQMEAPKGTMIAYATAPGKVALDGDGRNGLYTQELLAALETPGLKVEDVFKRVRSNVARATRDEQVPWESSSLTGDFYFKLAAAGQAGGGRTQADVDAAVARERALAEQAARDMAERIVRETLDRQRALAEQERLAREQAAKATAGQRPVDPLAVELAFWNTVKDASQVGDFQAYLKKYPEGQFAELARLRIEALRKAAAPAAVSPAPTFSPAAPAPAEPAAPPAGSDPGGPQPGERYTYRHTDAWRPGKTQELIAEVIAVTAAGILDRLQAKGSRDPDEWVFTQQPGLVMRRAGKLAFLDFSPYLPAFAALEPDTELTVPSLDADGSTDPIRFRAHVVGRESISVPAGKFSAIRVEIEGRRRVVQAMGVGGTLAARFQITVWYAPQLRRYVKLSQNTFNTADVAVDRDVLELVSHAAGGGTASSADDARMHREAEPVRPAPPAAGGGPAPGSRYIYRHTDEWKPDKSREVVNEVVAVTAEGIVDRLQAKGSRGEDESSFLRQPGFALRQAGNFSLLDFSPYLPGFDPLEPGTVLRIPALELPGSTDPVRFNARVAAREKITVPAGRFEAIRIDINGRRNVTQAMGIGGSNPARFAITVWYAPEIGRYVKLVIRSFNPAEVPVDRDVLELVGSSVGSAAAK